MFKATDTFERNQSVIENKIDDDMVLTDEEQENFFGINGVGCVIWRRLNQPQTFESIISHVCNEYDVTVEVCEKDSFNFLSQLLENELVIKR